MNYDNVSVRSLRDGRTRYLYYKNSVIYFSFDN